MFIVARISLPRYEWQKLDLSLFVAAVLLPHPRISVLISLFTSFSLLFDYYYYYYSTLSVAFASKQSESVMIRGCDKYIIKDKYEMVSA